MHPLAPSLLLQTLNPPMAPLLHLPPPLPPLPPAFLLLTVLSLMSPGCASPLSRRPVCV
jgi:hypothetical protein